MTSKTAKIALIAGALLGAAGAALWIGDRPASAGEGPPGGKRGGGRGGAAAYEDPKTQAKDDAEKKILDVLDELDGKRAGMLNVPIEDGRLLRILAESTGAKQVVEIGTSNGYSGLWFCLALRTTGGKLTTFDIDPKKVVMARENFKKAGVDGIATVVEGDAHQEIGKLQGPVDLVFIDAEKEGYPDYLAKLAPLVRPGGLILAHNMAMRGGGQREFLEKAAADKGLDTILLHMQGAGISLSLKKR